MERRVIVFMVAILCFGELVLSSRGDDGVVVGNYRNEEQQDRPTVGRCVSGQDCNKTECSVMGMQRYSEPRCEPLGGLGSPCRMYAEPEDKVLAFPHMTMECEQVYLQFCPCGEGLVCHEAECVSKRTVKELKEKERRQKLKTISSNNRISWARFNSE